MHSSRKAASLGVFAGNGQRVSPAPVAEGAPMLQYRLQGMFRKGGLASNQAVSCGYVALWHESGVYAYRRVMATMSRRNSAELSILARRRAQAASSLLATPAI